MFKLMIITPKRRITLNKTATELLLDKLLTQKSVLKKIQKDLDNIKADLPLVSIGPSGIGGKYQKEIK